MQWPMAMAFTLTATLACVAVHAAQPAAAASKAAVQTAQAPEQPFLGGFLRETRIIYPLKLGDWHAEGEHIYEQQEAGVSVTYRDPGHADRLITLYFYPAGVVEDDEVRQVADESIADINSNIGIPGGYSDIRMGRLERFTYEPSTKNEGDKPSIDDGKSGPQQGWSVDMRSVRDGRAYHSAMALLQHRLYFVKGRLTVGEKVLSRKKTRELLQGFIADLLDNTTLDSTGGCWMPLPIVRKNAPLSADGPGVLFNIGPEGVEMEAVAYADRIEALDVTSTQAKVTQLLVMSMTDRLFPGCEPASELIPTIPEGMREIRIEYRLPKGKEAVPSRRLRTRTSGLG